MKTERMSSALSASDWLLVMSLGLASLTGITLGNGVMERAKNAMYSSAHSENLRRLDIIDDLITGASRQIEEEGIFKNRWWSSDNKNCSQPDIAHSLLQIAEQQSGEFTHIQTRLTSLKEQLPEEENHCPPPQLYQDVLEEMQELRSDVKNEKETVKIKFYPRELKDFTIGSSIMYGSGSFGFGTVALILLRNKVRGVRRSH